MPDCPGWPSVVLNIAPILKYFAQSCNCMIEAFRNSEWEIRDEPGVSCVERSRKGDQRSCKVGYVERSVVGDQKPYHIETVRWTNN